ncbi:MAG TPA: hypothetical protein DDW27_09515 [Bacteroidales bacterium]|nr:hypothetical protein [Bacteroidales bacterium]
MKIKPVLILSLLLQISFLLSAQYYNTGQDPAGLKWLQIKTDRFKIIYPERYGHEGLEFARALDRAYTDMSSLYRAGRFRIPVIIHNYTSQSNGYVAWAPKRMEIYPTPEQNSIPLDNNTQLAYHEMTHVFQMESLNKGFSGAMSVLAGQQFPGVVASLVPLWYMEGDAVYNESVFSESGRGRSASFNKHLKAISLEKGKMYKYDKLLNGSYRHFVPDHYQSGYQIVTWSRIKYDPNIWNKALKLTANAPFLGDPLNLSLVHNTRKTERMLARETFDTLSVIWRKEKDSNNPQTYSIINPPKGKKYINYYSPVKIAENTYAAIKTSLSDPPAIVIIDSNDRSEKKIQSPGYMYPFVISAARKILVWVEIQPDPRWDNRNYSVIKLMDTRDRTIRQLTWKSRYMSASISPDAKIIAATENTINNRNNLVLINAGTGKIIKSVPVPENAYLQKAQWSDDGTKVCMISLTSKGEGILSFSLPDMSWEKLIPETPTDYQSAFIRHDTLFFVSSESGTENVYAMTPDKKSFMITNSTFGAIDPLPDGGRIVFADYSSSGNNICYTDIISETGNISPDKMTSSFLIDRIKAPESISDPVPEKEYVPERYKKWQHLFGFHSWMPFYADIDEIKSDPLSVRPGFTLFSQNQLSTLTTSLGYEYLDNQHIFHSGITWEGWYPVYNARIDYGARPAIFKTVTNIPDPEQIDPGINFTNTLSLPLRFSSGKFRQFLQPSFSSAYQNNYIYNREDSIYDYGQTQLNGRIYFHNSRNSSMRDIYPRLAQVVDLSFSIYPWDKDFYGSQTALQTAFFFPGIFRNNVIRLRYENEFQTAAKFLRPNRVHFPRGYENIISEEISFFSCDYITPLLYPDLNIYSLLYLKRIRAGFFYDFARGTNNYYLKRLPSGGLGVDYVHKYAESFSSYGGEIIADFHLLRIPYMISAGVQAAWSPDLKSPVIEAIFSIDIYGMSIAGQRFNRIRL